MSTYSNNIPQGNQDPTDSQPLLLDNFKAIFNAQNRNHVDFNDINNSGRHEVIELKDQASNPTPITGFGDLFVKRSGPLPTDPQNLFFLDDASKEFQLTNNFNGDENNGFIIFPGGLQFKWGLVTNEASGTNIPFSPFFTLDCFNVQLTTTQLNTSNINRTTMVQRIGTTPTKSKEGFTFRSDESPQSRIQFFWLAIGI